MTAKESKIFYPLSFKDYFNKKEVIITFIVGFIVVLYVAILFGASWWYGASLIDVFHNFSQFVLTEKHFIVGFTAATPKYIFFFELTYILIFILPYTRYRYIYEGKEYGIASWGVKNIFTEIAADHDDKNLVKVNFGKTLHKEDYYVNPMNYWIADGVYFSKKWKKLPNLNMLVVGPPGSGKTFKLIKLLLAQLLNNFVVTDPKGELYKQTGQFVKDNGYEVKVINLQSEELMSKCTRFNPFRYLRCETDVALLADVLFKATSDPNAQEKDPYFPIMAKNALKGILYLMFYTYPKERQNWREFVNLLESTRIEATKNGMCDKSDPLCLYNIFKNANDEWLAGKYTKGVPQKETLNGWVDIREIYGQPAVTAANIMSTLSAHATHMKYSCVKTLLSEDEIDITNTFGYGRQSQDGSYGSHKCILYIATDENNHIFDWIMGMIYNLFFNELYHLTDTDPSVHETLPIPLTFLMEEFANTYVPENMVELLTTMRSRGMNVIGIIQTTIQLVTKFSKKDYDRIFKGAMAITIILAGPKDPNECEDLSKLFGDMTIKKRTQGTQQKGNNGISYNQDVMKKPLLSANEISNLSGDGDAAICFMGGVKPLLEPKGNLEECPIYPLLIRGSKYSDEPPFSINFDEIRKKHASDFAVAFEGDETVEKIKTNKLLKVNASQIGSVLEAMDKDMFSDSENVIFEDFSTEIREILIEREVKLLSLRDIPVQSLKTIEMLENIGYDSEQINAIMPAIKIGLQLKEIVSYFNIKQTADELSILAEKIINSKGEIKNEKQN